jgi:hypothetical protein
LIALALLAAAGILFVVAGFAIDRTLHRAFVTRGEPPPPPQ